MKQIMAIDQGTTSSRAIIFDESTRPVATAQQEFTQHFPTSGWVEHDPEDIWNSVVSTCREAIEKAGGAEAIGITNQRETTLLWDRETGEPVHNAIVWQDRRTAETCARLKSEGAEPLVQERTGLLLDPYFSGTKLAWLLDNVSGARARADQGKLAFGTVESFLIWRLTGGKQHLTDATNAARTMLYDIGKGTWDEEILRLLNIPASVLPEVVDCGADFGETTLFGSAIPILGAAGDQQAATIGQACFETGMLKSTYGTGCFALLNTGAELVRSNNRMLSTIAYQFDGKPTYALEGSIFIAGAVVQWLRDGLGIIESAGESGALAEQADPEQALYLVPAFTGLGAPYWDPHARGAIFGLTRNSGPKEFAKAALQSVGYQTRDLLEAMLADFRGSTGGNVRVDGGMSGSEWAMQFLADILGAPVDRPQVLETTAMGAAWIAGHRAGIYPGQSRFAEQWALERTFTPLMDATTKDQLYAGWKEAVGKVMTQQRAQNA